MTPLARRQRSGRGSLGDDARGDTERPGGNEPYQQNQGGGQAFGFAEDGDDTDEGEEAAQ